MASFLSTAKAAGNSLAILKRIAGADQSAVQDCVERYGRMIWALAKQYTDSAAEAERIVPEIFTDIWQNAAACDLEVSDEAVWIALIARRRLSDCMLREDLPPAVEVMKNEFQPSPETPKKVFAHSFGKIHKTATVIQ